MDSIVKHSWSNVNKCHHGRSHNCYILWHIMASELLLMLSDCWSLVVFRYNNHLVRHPNYLVMFRPKYTKTTWLGLDSKTQTLLKFKTNHSWLLVTNRTKTNPFCLQRESPVFDPLSQTLTQTFLTLYSGISRNHAHRYPEGQSWPGFCNCREKGNNKCVECSYLLKTLLFWGNSMQNVFPKCPKDSSIPDFLNLNDHFFPSHRAKTTEKRFCS